MKWLRWMFAGVVGLGMVFQASAQTTPVPLTLAGVRIEPTVQVASSSLPLNGAGIRYRFFLKVYTAALYTAGPADSLEAIVANPSAKRLQITMLRDIDGNELGKLFTRGMERNAAREDMSRSINGVLRMADLFSRKKRLLAGENFSVDWLPGQGAQISVNGRAETELIREPEFFHALLSIWLGKEPADEDLKSALLGKTEKRRSDEPPAR